MIAGVASIPLLFGKLWVVNPYFWGRPAVRNVSHAVERISLLALVGGSVFMVFTGTINIARWYSPMPFFFTIAHYWMAYILIGSMIIHIGAKLATTRLALSSRSPDLAVPRDTSRLSRRGFLGALAATSLALVVTTAGETLRPLRRFGILAPRDPDVGSLGIPVNRPAIEAGVMDLARDPAFRLVVDGKVERPLSLSVEDLRPRSRTRPPCPSPA